MAERPKGYGLTAETNAKIAAKYDSNLEREAVSWMEAVVGERLNRSEAGPDALKEALKDGQFLCKLANKLQPGAVKKINTSKMAFKQMENINFFLDFISSYGVAKGDQFQTVDLYEGNNMGQVVITIHGVGRLAKKKFDGPKFGCRPIVSDKPEADMLMTTEPEPEMLINTEPEALTNTEPEPEINMEPETAFDDDVEAVVESEDPVEEEGGEGLPDENEKGVDEYIEEAEVDDGGSDQQ